MKLRGSLIVIICCFLLQFLNLTQKRYMFIALGGVVSIIIFVILCGVVSMKALKCCYTILCTLY